MLIEDNNFFQHFDASDHAIGIVIARFNHDINEQILKSAFEAAKNYKIDKSKIDIYKVAGSIEIPLALQKIAKSKKYNCLIVIGSIIRGDTPHFDYVAKIVSEGVLRVMLDENIPIGFGVLTTDNLKQAQERVGAGAFALESALQSTLIDNEILS